MLRSLVESGLSTHRRILSSSPTSLAIARSLVPSSCWCIPSPDDADDVIIQSLLTFFKTSFFTWVNSPSCSSCGKDSTVHKGVGPPSTWDEVKHLASRVEIYQCQACHALTRFPRYNDAMRLLETRKGRCGEWVNAFMMLAFASGYRVRYVVDVTDHVWVEIYSKTQGKFIHADPCESALASPMMYAVGWNKKLSYVVAIGPGPDDVADVSRKYIPDWNIEVVLRRIPISSMWFTKLLMSRPGSRLVEVDVATTTSNRVLERAEVMGRTSGSEEWRVLRGESKSGGIIIRIVFPGSKMGSAQNAIVERVVHHEDAQVANVDDGVVAYVRLRDGVGDDDNQRDMEIFDERGPNNKTAIVARVRCTQDWTKDLAQVEFKTRFHHGVRVDGKSPNDVLLQLLSDLRST